MADVMKLDLYGILEITHESTKSEIVKAYRKKALKCHPDKNPDNPKAAELFHQLSKALEVLTDAAAKAAYDKILKAKHAALLRHRELDSKRKKFKEDLEARESAVESNKYKDAQAARNLAEEIERLRKEGSSLLEQEQELLREELKKDKIVKQPATDADSQLETPKLKIKWKAKKSDAGNGGYTEEILQKLFHKYGNVTALLISKRKKGSAIIEFESANSAQMAAQNEMGLVDNPLTLSWLSGKPTEPFTVSNIPQSSIPASTSTVSEESKDFESIVLMRLRQAEERKRLIEDMKTQDSKDDNENG